MFAYITRLASKLQATVRNQRGPRSPIIEACDLHQVNDGLQNYHYQWLFSTLLGIESSYPSKEVFQLIHNIIIMTQKTIEFM